MPAFSRHGIWAEHAEGGHRRGAALLIGAMVTLLVGCGWLLGGGIAALAMIGAAMLGIGAMSCVPVVAVMEWHRAVPLTWTPGLGATLEQFARRAGLKAAPALYRLPGCGLNAMAAGSSSRSAIGLSDEILERLSPRELRAILAHEVSHIATGDTRLLALTCLISRLAQGAAQFALLAGLIFVIAADTLVLTVWQVAGFMAVVPVVSLLHLALSRNREFAADLAAVRLTGDAIGLIAALERIEAAEGMPRAGTLERLAALLRSHPTPGRRIASLADRFYPVPTGRAPLIRPVTRPMV